MAGKFPRSDSVGDSNSGGLLVVVRAASDFPAASGGVRTLADGYVYEVQADIDMGTDVFACTGVCTIEGLARHAIILETTSATAMVTVTGGVHTKNVTLKNDGGAVFAYTGTAGCSVTIEDTIVQNGAVDLFTGVSGSVNLLMSGGSWSGGTTGVQVAGAWLILRAAGVGFFQLGSSATMLELNSGATFTTALITGCVFVTDAAGETALKIDAGVLPSAEGEITSNVMQGSGTLLGPGITSETVGWWFDDNAGIEDSAAIGEMDFDGNTTATTITDGTSWHAIAGSTFTLSALSERFDEPAEGQLRYLGKDPKRMVLLVEMTADTASNNKTLNVRVRVYDASATTTSTIKEYDVVIRSTAQPMASDKALIVDLHQNDYVFLEIGSSDGTNMTILEAGVLAHVA